MKNLLEDPQRQGTEGHARPDASLTLTLCVSVKGKNEFLKLDSYLHQLSMKPPLCSYLKCSGPSGEWIEELTEKPQHVSVHVLSSTTALMSWTSSQENYNGTIVSVVSLTCHKQKESQRLEKQYCTQVKELGEMLSGVLTHILQPRQQADPGGHCKQIGGGVSSWRRGVF